MFRLLLLTLLFALLTTAAFAEDETLRVAVFGGANAWGSGIHLDDRFQAFPYLLGDATKVDNYASVSTGAANYDAVCLESIVGDENVYDVILLDFSHDVNSNVRKLAQRLRQRYPKAVIIFVKYWRPLQMQRSSKLSAFDSVDLPTWMQQRGLTDWKSSEFQTHISADDGIWFDQHHQDGMSNLLNDYAAGVNGYVVDLADISKDVKKGLADHIHYFSRLALLSQEGHKVLADHIQTVLQEQKPSPAQALVGDFGGGDSCKIWVTDGQTDVVIKSDGIKEFQRGKYSIEFTKFTTIFVNNPFPEERRVFLSFLVSSKDGVYPQTTIHTASGVRGGGDIRADITPVGSLPSATTDYVKTVPIGFLSPGDHKMYINPNMETGSGDQPFRLVGLTIGNEHVVPDVYDFVSLFSH
jgi:hypothetical protein